MLLPNPNEDGLLSTRSSMVFAAIPIMYYGISAIMLITVKGKTLWVSLITFCRSACLWNSTSYYDATTETRWFQVKTDFSIPLPVESYHFDRRSRSRCPLQTRMTIFPKKLLALTTIFGNCLGWSHLCYPTFRTGFKLNLISACVPCTRRFQPLRHWFPEAH